MADAKLEPAENVAERVLRECTRVGVCGTWDEREAERLEFNRGRATALLEADRAAVREAAIREALVWVRRYAGDGFATNLERALLPPTPSSKGESGDE